ncbi:MAG: hypothetical protein JWM04_194 [Verrucomicrobiales bacterium]|nr:hypothetical protein [Verrucomicrobiales bacterium]
MWPHSAECGSRALRSGLLTHGRLLRANRGLVADPFGIVCGDGLCRDALHLFHPLVHLMLIFGISGAAELNLHCLWSRSDGNLLYQALLHSNRGL